MKKSFKKFIRMSIATFVIITLTACSGGGGGGGPTTPGVAAVSPVNGATNVEKTATITATFSGGFDDLATQIPTEFTLGDSSGNTVSGTASFDDMTNIATFTPANNLGVLKTYTGTISSNVTHSGGTNLTQYNWSFTTAEGNWTNEQDLVISDVATMTDPHVARGGNGDAMAIWVSAGTDIYANKFTASGGIWGNEALISATSTAKLDLRLAMDNNGNAMAVWSDDTAGPTISLYARYYNGTTWGTTTTIEGNAGIADNAQVAFDSNGNAIVVWLQQNRIYANRYTGVWAGEQIIDAGATIAYPPQLAVLDNGDAIAVWAQNNGATNIIYANYYTAGGSWGGATSLGNSVNGSVPQIAMDINGNAMALWLEGNSAPYLVYAEYYDNSTGWTLTPVPLETDVAGVSITNIPQLGMDGDGNAIAIWRAAPTGGNDRLRYSRYDGSSWSTPGNVDNGFSDSSEASLAMDPEGNAIVVWREYTDAMASVYSTWANRYRVSSGWTVPVLLESDETASISAPEVSMDYNGNAAAIWLQDQGNGYSTTWSARFE